MNTGYSPIATAIRSGRYIDAANLLKRSSDNTSEAIALALETSYYLGEAERIRAEGSALLKADFPPAQAARIAMIVAGQMCDDGDLERGIAMYRRALELAAQADDATSICLATTYLLERTCDYTAFDASLPLASQARRRANRCGDPQITATVHLTFGRLEGRAGRVDTARRHFAIGRHLLESSPNLRLSAAVDNDEGILMTILGDFEAALEMFERGAALAAESGWPKGIAATAGNAGFVLSARNRYSDAEKHLRIAESQAFKSPGFHIAFAETRALIAMRAGQYQLAEQILAGCEYEKTAGGVWYQLARDTTKAQLMLRLQRWEAALSCAEGGLEQAIRLGAPTQAVPLILAKAEALVGMGHEEVARNLLLTVDRQGFTINMLAAYWVVLAKTLRSSAPSRGRRHLDRAIRVFQASGNSAAEAEAKTTLSNYGEEESGVPLEPVDFFASAEIFELACHPPSLARDAFARILEAECASTAALVAVGRTGTRIVAHHGWDDRQALAAFKRKAGIEVIAVGDHCDEAWQIIASLRTAGKDRAAFLAIKKLVGAAVELERYRREEKQRAALWPAEALDSDPESIWASEQMSEVLKIARRIAPTPSLTILLTGETGTGKEMLARAIHRASDRADKTLLPFNCTAVPRDMLESQLFGYRRGAFTGADVSFPGVIRSAAGGTLFLDEIAEIPLDVQPKLLRFLETHEIHPLGEPQPIKVDVRIVAATNANLEQLVAEGKFREDLFYRLNVVRLKLPPLRERREEIPPLVEHYLRKYSDEQKKGRLTLADETLEYLLLFSWPGNVRQLANEVRRMVAMAEADSTLTPALLSPEIQASRRTIPAASGPATEPEIRVRIDQPLPAAVEMLEQTMIRSALMKSRGRVEEAARLLGISRKGLFLKRRRWGLDHRQAS